MWFGVIRFWRPIITGVFGQQVVVENRGGGVIAGDLVAKSPPDGYTLLLYGNTLWLLPLMRSHMPCDPALDFLPVSLAAGAVNILVVHPSLPVKSVKELILRRQDVKDRFGSVGVEPVGSSPEELATLIKTELARMGRVIRDAGIRED